MGMMEKEWIEIRRSRSIWGFLAVLVFLGYGVLGRFSSGITEATAADVLIAYMQQIETVVSLYALIFTAMTILSEREHGTILMKTVTEGVSSLAFVAKKVGCIHLYLFLTSLSGTLLITLYAKFWISISVLPLVVFWFALYLFVMVFSFMGGVVGFIGRTPLKVISTCVLLWLVLFFVHDLILISLIPGVTLATVKGFALLYFVNPVHSIHHLFTVLLGQDVTQHATPLIEQMFFLQPAVFLLISIGVVILGGVLTVVLVIRKGVSV